jgi:hypothetical protein
MHYQDAEFCGLPIEELGRYLRQQFYAEAERDRLLRQLAPESRGQAAWRALAGWIVALVKRSGSSPDRAAHRPASSAVRSRAGPRAWSGK